MTVEETDRCSKQLSCTLVVATWRRPDLLEQTLRMLLQQSYPAFDIVVVCDGDDASTRTIAANFSAEPRIRWIFHSTNRGLAAARNTGAREAGGDVVLFMDDDVAVAPDLVGAHMDHHTSAVARRLVVCGMITEELDGPLASYVDRRLHEIKENIMRAATEKFQAPGPASVGDHIELGLWCGLNCSVGREAFQGSGGFNEYFCKSGEEMELGERLHLGGFEFVFEPRASVLHKNTKKWSTYYRSSWGDRGELDVYRVFHLGEKSAQTRKLGSAQHGYFLDRAVARLNWKLARPLLSTCDWLESAANRTESSLLFGLWARAARDAEYWSHARTAGCTMAEVKRVAKACKRALMLHSICEPETPEEASYYLSPERFEKMMGWFVAAGYETATLAQWLEDDLGKKQVLLSFDDGYDDLYTRLLPLAVEHRLAPVIFLVADRIGAGNDWDQPSGLRARNLLSWAQIREMQSHGFQFGSHTLTHPYLPGLADAQLRREVSDSKQRLEDALGAEVAAFAYPYGGVDRRVRSAVAEAGYKLAFTTLPGPNWWNDPLSQRRADVNQRTTLLDFAFQLRSGYGFTQSISERLGSLERDLPTRALRKAAGAIRSFGHSIRHDRARSSAARKP